MFIQQNYRLEWFSFTNKIFSYIVLQYNRKYNFMLHHKIYEKRQIGIATKMATDFNCWFEQLGLL